MFKKKKVLGESKIEVKVYFDTITGKSSEKFWFTSKLPNEEYKKTFAMLIMHTYDSSISRDEASDLYELLGKALLTGKTQTKTYT